GIDRILAVIGDQPLEALAFAVAGVERGQFAVEAVEVADELLHAAMRNAVEEVPGEPALLAPLLPLREFLAHEEELLARIAPHEGVEGAKRGELLQVVAGHLLQKRALAVDDLVVAERRAEILREGVEHAEGQVVVVVPAVDRVAREVLQRVVHEPHVPLEAESQAALVDRLRYSRPGGRLLGNRHDAGVLAVGDRVHAAEERDRLEVLVAAILVGNPVAGLTRIIEVEHRGDGIDAHSVEMEMLEPIERAVDEEGSYFLAAEIVDRGVPVRMIALP